MKLHNYLADTDTVFFRSASQPYVYIHTILSVPTNGKQPVLAMQSSLFGFSFPSERGKYVL